MILKILNVYMCMCKSMCMCLCKISACDCGGMCAMTPMLRFWELNSDCHICVVLAFPAELSLQPIPSSFY